MRRISATIVLVVTALCTLLPAGVASAALITVCPGNTCDFSNIQDAIDASADGDTVLVYPGTYTDVYANGYVFSLNGKSITVYGASGPEQTIIDGQGVARGIYHYSYSNQSVIEGFTVANCVTPSEPGSWKSEGFGAGMFIWGFANNTTQVNDCIFINNEATYSGGGVYAYNCIPEFNDCVFVSNLSGDSGGGAYAAGPYGMVFNLCQFIDNAATGGSGGGVYAYTWGNIAHLFDSCIFEGNVSNGDGGGMFGSSVTLSNCTVSANQCNNNAGGVYLNCPSSVNNTLEDTYFCLNTPENVWGCWANGGGNTFGQSCACPGGPCVIYVPSDYATIQEAIDDAGDGDVIEISPGTYNENLQFYSRGQLSLRPAVGRGKVVIDGGGAGTVLLMSDDTMIANGGDIYIDGITITGGDADDGRGGGALVDSNFNATFTDSTISNNTGWLGGGGVYVVSSTSNFWNSSTSNTKFENCIITNNTTSGKGGGIFYENLLNNNATGNGNESTPVVLGCTISSNQSDTDGGGVYIGSAQLWNNNGSVTVAFEECIISENISQLGNGGGVSINYSATPRGLRFGNNNGSLLPITFKNCTIVDNTAYVNGGAISIDSGYEINGELSSVALEAGMCTGNSSGHGGGAVHVGAGFLTAESTTFEGNTASFYGGAIYVNRDAACGLEEAFVIANESSYGGGIFCDISSTMGVTSSTVTGNSAYQGGAIFGFESITRISGSLFDENAASQEGGAIYNLIAISEIDTTHFCSNTPDDIYGAWLDDGDVTFEEICGSPAACLGDTNADYNVDVLDLLYVILVWNTDNPQADFNDDGFVDVMDLLLVISNWGMCE